MKLKISSYLLNTLHFDNNFQDLVNSIPTKLINLLHYEISKSNYNEYPYFSNKSSIFITMLLTHITLFEVEKDEIIYNYNENVCNIYFIFEGEVNLYFNIENTDTLVIKLLKNCYFGDLEYFFLLDNKLRTTKTIATSYCKLYKLNIKNLKKIYFDIFPDVGMNFLSEILERNIRTKQYLNGLYKRFNSNLKTIILCNDKCIISKRFITINQSKSNSNFSFSKINEIVNSPNIKIAYNSENTLSTNSFNKKILNYLKIIEYKFTFKKLLNLKLAKKRKLQRKHNMMPHSNLRIYEFPLEIKL